MSVEQPPPPLRLIVGLGNPGADYEGTRHNVGFMVLDALAAEGEFSFEKHRKWKAEFAQDRGVIFAKPTTFMNRSGEAVAKFTGFYKIPPAQILVIYDEMDLPLGTVRLREKGSCGGHNGMADIARSLGSEAIPRLRVGIGRSQHPGDSVNHVLGKFSDDERSALAKSLEKALLAVRQMRADGISLAMNTVNRKAEDPKDEKPESDDC